jgi:hypothetical protein
MVAQMIPMATQVAMQTLKKLSWSNAIPFLLRLRIRVLGHIRSLLNRTQNLAIRLDPSSLCSVILSQSIVESVEFIRDIPQLLRGFKTVLGHDLVKALFVAALDLFHSELEGLFDLGIFLRLRAHISP